MGVLIWWAGVYCLQNELLFLELCFYIFPNILSEYAVFEKSVFILNAFFISELFVLLSIILSNSWVNFNSGKALPPSASAMACPLPWPPPPVKCQALNPGKCHANRDAHLQRHVGAGKTMKNVMGRIFTSICSPAPVAPPAPATALPPTTKSSLKLKSKVGARTLLLMIDFQRIYVECHCKYRWFKPVVLPSSIFYCLNIFIGLFISFEYPKPLSLL